MKAKILALFAAICVLAPAWAAKTGSYYKDAKTLSIGKSAAVTLVPEYDEFYDTKDEKYDQDSGVYWFKTKLSRGMAYTIWISGGSAAQMAFDIDTDPEDDDAPMAGFDIEEINSSTTQVGYMYADEWDEEDPSSAWYYICISGDVGAKTTIYSASGIRSFSSKGDSTSPEVLKFSTSQKSVQNRKCIDGEYYFRASLKEGCKYRVRTTGGTSAKPVTLDVDSSVDFDAYEDPSYPDANNQAFVIVPEASGTFTFVVSGTDDSQKFNFYYRQVPTLAIGSHKAYTLNAGNEYSASFVPGRISTSESYYDSIIDEYLCVVSLKKDQVVVFDGVFSENADLASPVEMIAYDATGKVLARNSSIGDGSTDVRTAIKATADGKYYVGVYDPELGIYDTASNGTITVTATLGEDIKAPDSWDPADDVYSTATPIVPYPATTLNDFAKTTTNELVGVDGNAEIFGSAHGTHAFNGVDWYDVYAVACRKGFAYQFQTAFPEGGEMSDLILGYKVFTLNGTKEVNQTANITELGEGGLADGIVLKAVTNMVHYIRVYVKDTRGLDYPEYNMHAIVSKGATKLGLLTVGASGVAGTFSVGSEKTKYPTGMTIALEAEAAKKITFNAVTDFNTPAAQTVTLDPWAAADSDNYDPEKQPITTIVGKYSDKYDAKYVMSTKTTKNAKTGKTTTTNTYSPADGDATVAGAFTVVATNSVKSYKRSLYVDDPQDTFKFASADGWCYNISLVDTSVDGVAATNIVGDAMFTVSNSVDGVVAENVKSVEKLRIKKGTNWIFVRHADSGAPVDSSYTLKINGANVGYVRFSSKTFTAKETAASVALTVKRTANGGAQTVYWTTEEDTAKPGEDYYPANGTLTWAAGNKSDKTIEVRLIPDLYPTFESNKTFRVRLWGAEPADFASDEYSVAFTSGFDVATVTLTEATAVNAGTVSVTGYGPSEDEATNVVANTAKPVVSGEVGDPIVVRLSRTVGTNGNVAVKITTPVVKTDTAKAGTDFVNLTTDNVVTWGDGDAEDKFVTIETLPTSNYTLSKQFTVKIAALTTGAYAGYAKPTLFAATATAKVLNKTVGVTSATFAKTVAGVGGITMASTGTWFIEKEDGMLRSGTGNGTLTYTLTGPGFFAFKMPKVVNDSSDPSSAKLTCSIGTLNAKKALVASETIDCLDAGNGDRVVRLVPSGSRVVRFSFTGGNGTEYAEFEKEDDTGLPFKWVQLSKVAVKDPMSKSVLTTNGVEKLEWTLPESLADETIYVDARLSTDSAALSKTNSSIAVALRATEADMPDEFEFVAGKTYYWKLFFSLDDAEPAWTAHPTTWNFSVLAKGNPETIIFNGTDAYGESVADAFATGNPVKLIQGVKTQSSDNSITLGGSTETTYKANGYRLLAGKLPKGVSLNATSGKLTGAPSEVGTFRALLQSYNLTTTKKTVNKKKTTVKTYRYGTTLPLTFEVEPLASAIGTFRASLVEDGEDVTRKAAKSGFLTVSVTSAGKITATAKIAGNSYSFTGTGFDELSGMDETSETPDREFTVTLKNITKLKKKVNKKTVQVPYTNWIDVVVHDCALTNAEAMAKSFGSARLTMNIPNNLIASATSCQSDIVYGGALLRANGAVEAVKTALADYAGYYTLAVAPTGVSVVDGVPLGNGYITFTLSDTGAVKFSGSLADGTAVSGSSAATFQGDTLESPHDCELVVPISWSDNTRAISGQLKLVWAEDDDGNAAPVVDSSAVLLWSRNAAAAASLDAKGFIIETSPVGGWYNTTANLQAYYLNSDLAIQAVGADELSALVTTAGVRPGASYTFKEDCVPNDLELTLAGNKPSVAARKLVKESSTLLYDLAASVNPWSTTYTLARATGLVSGTFTCWSETTNTTKQVQITKVPHKGVILFNRDAASPLDENVWSAGYYLIQATKNWKASLPFNVIETPISGGRDWNEIPVPNDED